MFAFDIQAVTGRMDGREEALAQLTDVLAAGRSGAVVVGPFGIGKTALVRAAAADPAFHAVTIRGSQVSGRTSFGALAGLIAELTEGVATKPAQLLQELEQLLLERAGQKRILLLLDGAEHLDDLTAMVVSQLVRRSTVSVLATAENLSAAAPEFTSLWTDGLLHRIDLAPLKLDQTRQLMESLLAGRVSLIAAQALQCHSGGNPHLVTLLTRDQTEKGSLVHRDGVWVLAKQIGFSEQVAEVVTARLMRLHPAERSLVQLLALADELPLDTVLQLIPAETVDALQEERMAEVTPAGTIRLTAQSSSTAIAGSIAPGRSRELWEEVADILDPTLLGSAALAGFARWTLACNGRLDPVAAQRAAGLAVAAGDPRLALQYIASVPSEQRSQAMVLEEVRARMSSGDYLGALGMLEKLSNGGGPVEVDEWSEVVRYKTLLLRALPGHCDPAQELEKAWADVRPGDAESVRRKREAEVMLARAALALDSGRMRDVPAALEASASDPLLSPSFRAQARALRAQYLALSGRAELAMELVGALEEGGMRGPLAPAALITANARIFQTLVAAGEYDRASEMLGRLLTDGSLRPFHGGTSEVILGMVQALAGRADKARAWLAPSIGQLELDDPNDILPLAQTLSAYLHLLDGNTAEAKQGASRIASFRHRPSAQLQLTASLLRVQAELAVNPLDLCRELRSAARTCLEQGMVAPALDRLAAAARHGDLDAARELADAASQAEGRGARALYCFGAGLAQDDAALLVESAQLASSLGNVLLANTAARSALRLLQGRPGSGSREQARIARQIEHLSFRELRDANTIQALMETLTPFEAMLAHRAAGPDTRAQISSEMNLSPRTIDWHLGKIFEKLRVSGRSELGELLGQF